MKVFDGVFRGSDRGDVSPAGDLLVFVSDGPISFNSERNGGKNAGKNCVFAFPQRAMGCGNLMLPATRSRKSSFFVSSKDCLSNSAAAADTNVEQRFWFYRRASHSRNHIKTAKAFQLGYFALRRQGCFALRREDGLRRATFPSSWKSSQKSRKKPKVSSLPCALRRGKK